MTRSAMLGEYARVCALALLLLSGTRSALAGGGPQDVLVVVNANSSESLEIGNAYRRARGIPYRQVLAIKTTTAPTISYAAYRAEIEDPVRAFLKGEPLQSEVTCIVLTRGVPLLVDVDKGRSTASLLAAMNLPRDSKSPAGRLANPYFRAPDAFSRESAALQGMYLVTVLHGYHTWDAEKLIANGVAADGTAPAGRFVLQSSPHIPRAAQRAARELLALRGLAADVVSAPPADQAPVMGYFSGGIYSGLTKDTVTSLSFLPGAVADLAQNFSAAPRNFDDSATPVLVPAAWFVQAGISGVHGVVGDAGMASIPAVASQEVFFDRYTSQFSLAESFYTALPYLNWQNVVIGDPLCAPYARPPRLTVEPEPEVQEGVIPIRVSASSSAPGATISRLDLYLDDGFVQTIYEPDNPRVVLRIGDDVVAYALPRRATLRTLLEGIADAVNNHERLKGLPGVRAEASLNTSTVRLAARTPGQIGNGIPVAVSVENDRATSPGVMARAGGPILSGGGQAPKPARGTISFLGRQVTAGDEVTLQIQRERLAYTAPDVGGTMAALLDALVDLVAASPALQRADGVRAARDPQGMPFITLEARTAGERGNRITYQLSVKPAAGSKLRGYPEVPTYLGGGHDGTAASLDIRFLLGEPTARATYLLDTRGLPDGYHHLRVVAYDGSPAQVQGAKELPLNVNNVVDASPVALPEKLGPASRELTLPLAADDQVARVAVYVDGQLCGSANERPFSPTISLAGLGRGVHDLWVEARDAGGTIFFVTPPVPLEVIVPPDLLRVVPGQTALAGGTAHRITGAGFQPNCQVRLAGVAVRSAKLLSPNLIEVVCAGGTAQVGPVEVANPDGTSATLPRGFEYYQPRVARISIEPEQDVVAPGGSARFTARCLDQFGVPITAQLAWEAPGAAISQSGVFAAPTRPGPYQVRARPPEDKNSGTAAVIVGPAPLRDGRLRQWLVLGPFPDPDYAALETSQLDEAAALPAHDKSASALLWRSIYAGGDFLDLAEHLIPNVNAVAYAHVYLSAPAETQCTLIFGSDDGIRIWLNGQLIYSLRVRRAADPNQASLPVTLNAGWNRLLVKVDQGIGAWGFYMRVEARDGKALTGLAFALDPPPADAR